MRNAKLGEYNCSVRPGPSAKIDEIWVPVTGHSDVIIADISSEIIACESHIYMDGYYYMFIRMYVEGDAGDKKLVIEAERLG